MNSHRIGIHSNRLHSHGVSRLVAAVLLTLLGLIASSGDLHAAGPVILPIPDQFTLEDEPIIDVPFTVFDPDTPADQLRFTASLVFSNGVGARDPNLILIGGAGTNRWFSIYPPADASGPAQATITVTDPQFQTGTARFQVFVQPINDAPRLSVIPDQVAVRGQGTLIVPFSFSDPDSAAFQVRLRASSSRSPVVPDVNLRIGAGTGTTNRILFVTLPTNTVAGSTAITIHADDGQATNTTTFVLTVFPPAFERVGQIQGGSTAFEPVWGDFDGDGRMDVVISGSSVLTNRGNGQFAPGIFLNPGFQPSGGAAADHDGDGRLDLLLYAGGIPPRLFRNVGPATPNFVSVPLGVRFGRGRSSWADIDGDTYLDIVSGGTPITWLKNDGRGGFTEISTTIPTQNSTSLVTPVDFDNDGDPDLLVAPEFTSTSPTLPRLYVNDGTGRFTDSQMVFPQGRVRAAGFTDFDGNGLPDLWLVQTPALSSGGHAIVALRQEQGRWVESFRLTEPNFTQNPVVPVWADFDNDGDVDFVGPFWPPQPVSAQRTNFPAVYRNDGSGRFTTSGLRASAQFGTQILPAADFDEDGSVDLLVRNAIGALWPLHNLAPAPDALPDAPTALEAVVAGDTVALFWNDAFDGNQSAALTYNVRVGTAPGRNDVVASMSAANGVRMMPAPGNAGYNTWRALTLPLERLHAETLYWSVQAVDNSLQGGPFAPEQTLFINPPGNQPPLISGLSDLTFPEDTTRVLTFFVADDRSPPESLFVRAAPSDTNLFLLSGVRLSGFVKTNDTLRVDLALTPRPGATGQAIITLSATDRAGLVGERIVIATVTPVNDPAAQTVRLALLPNAAAPTSLDLVFPANVDWAVEASDDLHAWYEWPVVFDPLAITSDGMYRLSVPATNRSHFFRARRVD